MNICQYMFTNVRLQDSKQANIKNSHSLNPSFLPSLLYPDTFGHQGHVILGKVTTTFKMVYTSENTGARRRLTIYRPDCPPGYFTLGDYTQASDTDTPNYGVSLCIKEIGGTGYLYPPVGYVQVWNGIHTSGDNTGALCKPLPPGKDYVAMGYVAVGSYSPEPPTNLLCVHKSAAFLAKCGVSLWSDHGSRSHRTCSICSVKPSLDYLNLGTFVATRGYRAPSTGEF